MDGNMLTEEDLIKNDKITKMLEDSSNKTKSIDDLAIMVLEILDLKIVKNKTEIFEATKRYIKRVKDHDIEYERKRRFQTLKN
jgi:hypothetical protein